MLQKVKDVKEKFIAAQNSVLRASGIYVFLKANKTFKKVSHCKCKTH